MRSSLSLIVSLALFALLVPTGARSQEFSVSDDLKKRIEEWAPKNPRQGGTQPEDWRYTLSEGVTTKQITFYSDDTACYAKMFYPKGFDAAKKYPGVVLGHGTNAISVGIEKYGARFAEEGLVAMVIDYRGYGYSDGWVNLQEKDTTTDDQRITEKTAPIVVKRTRLLTTKQIEDYRNAISYLQGEPGVDPEKIGIWGSSLSGSTVVAIAGMDARVKAVVSQVSGVGPGSKTKAAPNKLSPALLEDAIKRARTGQGAEVDAGFSIHTKVDMEMQQVNRELRTSELIENIPKSTAILFLPGEKDELVGTRSVQAAQYLKEQGNPSEAVVIPAITHFQAYSGPAFEATGPLAAKWFAKYLK